MAAVLGIDPGVNGGLAVIDGSARPIHVQAFNPDMTRTELKRRILQAISALRALNGNRVWLEKVGYRPTDGGQGAFTFGRVYGMLEMGVLMCDIELHDVTPLVWQAELECLTAGNKNVSKRKAMDLFGAYLPKITHAIADALLLAEYGRRRLRDAERRNIPAL